MVLLGARKHTRRYGPVRFEHRRAAHNIQAILNLAAKHFIEVQDVAHLNLVAEERLELPTRGLLYSAPKT